MTFLIGNEHRSSTRKTVCCFAFIASVMLSGCGPQQVMGGEAVGANHMRTTSHREVTGLPAYEAVPPPAAKMLSQYMRGLGYYTTNNYKRYARSTARYVENVQ